MLAARVATAIVGIPVLIGLVWIGGPVFWLTTALAAAQAAREAKRLIAPASSTLAYTLIVLSSVGLVLGATVGSNLVLAILGLSIGLFLTESLLPGITRPATDNWAARIATVLYAGLPLALLVILRDSPGAPIPIAFPFGLLSIPSGAAWVFAVLSVTWSVDTVAYLIGRTFGKHRFSLRLSPKKTWEGTVAGVASGTLAFAAWSPAFGWRLVPAVIGGFLLAISCVTGDLAESALKRSAGVKDAGSLLPGHGGLLDRIDSLAFSIIVVFLLQALDQSVHFLGR